MCPSKVVVLAVEDLLCSSSLVVVLYDLLIGHVPVVGQYTAVCVLAVEEVKLLSLTLGKNVLQIQVKVFHAVAATAENGEDGPYYLAVLIAYQLTAKSQVGVDYRGKNTVKSVQNEKYSAKSSDFLRFLLYLCHVIDDFACLDLQH